MDYHVQNKWINILSCHLWACFKFTLVV